MEPVINVRKADPRTGKIYKSMYIRTLSFACLNFYHDLFYKGNKVVPLNIQDLLTPVGLAHLIMGGWFFASVAKGGGVILICTESFTKGEQELIIAALDFKFGVKASLNKRIATASHRCCKL